MNKNLTLANIRKVLKEEIKSAVDPLEERSLGLERRISGLDNKIDDVRTLTVRAVAKLAQLDGDRIKFEDKLTLAFRNFESLIQTLVDPLLKDINAREQEKIIHKSQHDNLRDDVEGLKKIHPKFSHVSI